MTRVRARAVYSASRAMMAPLSRSMISQPYQSLNAMHTAWQEWVVGGGRWEVGGGGRCWEVGSRGRR